MNALDGQRTKVLFIGGLGRSGSTLIEKLINELPHTQSVGETLHLWERGVVDQQRCGCGEAFNECPFWTEVGRLAFGSWSELDVQRVIKMRYDLDRSRNFASILKAVRSGELKDDQAEYVDHYQRLLNAAADVRAKQDGGIRPVLLESSKHVSTAGLLAASSELDVRILHVLRDPRGVAYSWTKNVARPEAEGELMPRYRPSRTALRWVTDNAAFDLLARTVPTLRLRYESFIEEPAKYLAEVADLVDLKLSDDDLAFIDGEEVSLSQTMHSASGNPMRFDSGDTLTLRRDEAWRAKLPQKAKLTVSSMCLPSLTRYGYPLS